MTEQKPKRKIFKFKPKFSPKKVTNKALQADVTRCPNVHCGGAMVSQPFDPQPFTPQQTKEFGQFRWFHAPASNLLTVWTCDRCNYTVHSTKRPTMDILVGLLKQQAPSSWKTAKV